MSTMTVRPITEVESDRLSVWRALALDLMPYMATTMYALRAVAAPGLGTFAVDKHLRLYIDFDKAAGWDNRLCAEVLLHECSHILQDHAGQADEARIDDREREDWNVAGDAAINDDLRDAGCAAMTTLGVLPKDIPASDYETVWHYFEKLRQQAPAPLPASGAPYGGCGSASGGKPAPSELSGDDNLGGAADPATPAETERVRVRTAAAIREAAAKNAGSVPGGMVELADSLLAPPKVPWQQVLGRTIRSSVKAVAGSQDTSHTRRNARRHNERLLTPAGNGNRIVHAGHVDFRPQIVVVRDTSASMSPADLARVTSEVEGISRGLQVRGTDLVVLDVDTRVAATRRYQGAASLAEASGRGGTNMVAGIDAALERKPRPSVIVVLTDGYTPWPTEQPSRQVKIVACVIGAQASAVAQNVPAWIRTVVVEEP